MRPQTGLCSPLTSNLHELTVTAVHHRAETDAITGQEEDAENGSRRRSETIHPEHEAGH